MNRYKPSIFTLMENQKSSHVFIGMGIGFVLHITVSLLYVAFFYSLLNSFGFWYSVGIFAFIRILRFYFNEYNKYQMEQKIMKGGGK